MQHFLKILLVNIYLKRNKKIEKENNITNMLIYLKEYVFFFLSFEDISNTRMWH